MPHAVSKGIGLQALILCGPGSSFPTFTANPDENPKALLPIANRPMVWYPLDFCNRAGITDITLICPPAASEAIRAALKTNPFLTSLPAPAVVAPQKLDHTTGTAAILRLPEVRDIVTADFAVLPCDLVCELGGETLLQAWMVKAASLADVLAADTLGYAYLGNTHTSGGGGGGGNNSNNNHSKSNSNSNGSARRHASGTGLAAAAHSGGLGVWYDTRTALPAVKGEEADFVATVPLADAAPSAKRATSTSSSVLPHLERVVTSMPLDSLNDLMEDQDGYAVRHGLLRRHRRVRMRTTHRDAHIYVFPQWVMDLVQANEHMDSIGEDVVGWWAKAEWQRGLPEKLGMAAILQDYDASASTYGAANGGGNGDGGGSGGVGDNEPAPRGLSSTGPAGTVLAAEVSVPLSTSAVAAAAATTNTTTAHTVSARTLSTPGGGSGGVAADVPDKQRQDQSSDRRGLQMPPLLAYIHPSTATAPLIRRVDTSKLLLTVSLQLAKLPSVEEVAAAASASSPSSSESLWEPASPFAHARKVAYPEGVKTRTTITRADSLVADNVTVEEKVSIRECVVGANCQIHEGAKLHQCLLMEGVVVGKGCRLTRCILGKRSEIGAASVLTDCEVQENLLVEPKTEETNNNFMSSEGLEATAEEMDEAMQDVDDDENGGIDA
ncbi:translation initiation factor eIF2B [Niveomyces insectorum RCEF 264]|uniref:Mannose-1-phosphate guanyltransferase n=1 Tax=Niveomyces insectorum RCEF 264 TaxID=1081102 RepID=A0A167QEE1_9HYPO|nr:translation initiation factor eIF2B [Niveomyces insectorum RCEF 264]